jgi:hypothetical protein
MGGPGQSTTFVVITTSCQQRPNFGDEATGVGVAGSEHVEVQLLLACASRSAK